MTAFELFGAECYEYCPGRTGGALIRELVHSGALPRAGWDALGAEGSATVAFPVLDGDRVEAVGFLHYPPGSCEAVRLAAFKSACGRRAYLRRLVESVLPDYRRVVAGVDPADVGFSYWSDSRRWRCPSGSPVA